MILIKVFLRVLVLLMIKIIATCPKSIKFIYFLQTSAQWDMLLYVLTWVYLFMTIAEPSYKGQISYFESRYKYKNACMGLEITIVTFYWLNFLLAVFHRMHNKSKSFKKRFLTNKKMISKLVVNCLFLADMIHFYINFSELPFRFSRIFRPGINRSESYLKANIVGLFLYNKELRRTLLGIVTSIKTIIDLVLFFLLFAIIWSIIGVRLIGHQEDQDEVSP